MNNEEAKFILEAYRPTGQDAANPEFAEALEQVRRDPGLAKWFADQQATDAVIGEKLKQTLVPPNLRGLILAGAKVTRKPPSYRRGAVLALAAAIGILLTLSAVLLRDRGWSRRPDFRAEILNLASKGPQHLELDSSDFQSIRAWLKSHQGETDLALPPRLQDAALKGCRVLDWRGHKVTLVCLTLNGAHLDFFVIDRADLLWRHPEKRVRFDRFGAVSTAAWSGSGKTYLLAGNLSPELLRKFF